MKKLDWLKKGITVTASRMAEAQAAKLPAYVMALLWVKHTINRADMDIINAGAKRGKATKKNATKGAQ
jgi:hypothetical protein